ncbi:MAG TPA: SUMF1/EgtB/PvdO family nonheme iron enzyme, partial [Bacteroidia bacterium]|nr:SUMF1/EgtB/PvdO family nonheme iron enzyme [Bacteroidia bacterium]
AAAAGLDYTNYPLGYQKLTDRHNFPVSNTLEYSNLLGYHFTPAQSEMQREWGLNNVEVPVMPVLTGKENSYGLFNFLGNVSEIIDGNCFKGLNYETALDGSTFLLKRGDYQVVDSTAYGYDYKFTFRYKKPQAWLGFRCACKVLNIPDDRKMLKHAGKMSHAARKIEHRQWKSCMKYETKNH